MLTNLSIHNIILIEKLNLKLEKGLCVLTGETGSGKSILLDALGFAMGERGSVRLLRTGAEKGSVTAVFDIKSNKIVKKILSEYDLEHDNELVIRRVILDDGRSRAFLNDNPVSINLLRDISEHLVEIHGQHDQRGLLNPASNRAILDQYGNLEEQLTEVRQVFDKYNTIANELNALKEIKEKAESERDYLEHILNELNNLSPKQNEEDELSQKRSMLMNGEKISEAINSANVLLHGGGNIERQILSVISLLNRSGSDAFKTVTETLERAAIEVNEATAALDKIASETPLDQGNLEKVEDRLFNLRGLARKHRVTVNELAGFRLKVEERINLMDNNGSLIESLEKSMVESRESYIKKCKLLTKARVWAAVRLEEAIHKELAPLKMENTRFKVSIDPITEDNWSRDGMDKVEFLASTNPGTPVAPLAKIASGGELSRFMLAMKVVLSNLKSVPTIIFDEIDTGIGGAVADAVGKRLALLGKNLQVLAITHQPQVAALGKQHLKISKIQDRTSGTVTNVLELTEKLRKEEIARMLSGAEITKEARAAAEKLLGTANI